jgi:hypothetical protein
VTHHSRPTRRLVALAACATLALAACGDDSDSTTSTAETTTPDASTTAATSAPATTAAPADTTAAAGDTTTPADTAAAGDTTAPIDEPPATILVDSVDDIPQECVDILAEFLRSVEPSVADVDWDAASVGEFQTITAGLEAQFAALDEREAAEGCDAYQLGDDAASLAAAIEIAEAEAPGTVGWLEFLGSMTVEPANAADLPQDCAGAIAYIEQLVAAGGTFNDLQGPAIAEASAVLNVLGSQCDSTTLGEFTARPEITAFLGA